MGNSGINPILLEHSKRTIDEALEKLEKYGRVFVERPTGFGKTYMLTRIAGIYSERFKDKNILYVYPLDIIPLEIKNKYGTEREEDTDVRNAVNNKMTFVSYSLLTRRIREKGEDYWYNLLKDKYSIILLDEAHITKSKGFLEVYNSIKELIGIGDKIRMIGVTATPERMDDTIDSNVLNDIFDNIQVYSYNLANCIQDGIIPKLVIGSKRYNIKELADKLKHKKRIEARNIGATFDDESFNVELGKIMNNSGTEPSILLKYLRIAGHDLTSKNEKYYKFIIFFNGIEDIASNGPIVEDWFNEAFNVLAKRELNLRKSFKIRSHYLTSSDDNGDIACMVKLNTNRYKYNDTNKLIGNVLKEDYTIDLIMTINMTNMGYHDDNITGIVMLRGTRSKILYYQQLGRAISVTSKFNPLIYDFVNNSQARYCSLRDIKREIAKQVLVGRCGEVADEFDYSSLTVTEDGDYDAFEDFMNRWSDVYYSDKSKIIYLYEDRKAPIVAISADTGKSCSDIAKILIDSDIELRAEDAMYEYEFKALECKEQTVANKKNLYKIIKCLYSNKAQSMIDKLDKHGLKPKTLYKIIKKMIKERK